MITFKPPILSRQVWLYLLHRKASVPCLLASLLALPAFAQKPSDAGKSEPPSTSFQVLKRWEVRQGDHSLIYQRIAPPPPATPVPPPVARPLSAQELEALRRREAKQQMVLFFSATVLDHQLTELRWFDEQGPHRAFSNIDFHHFSGMGEIETADTFYTLLLALDSATPEALAERTRAFPQVALLPRDRSAWLLAETSGSQSTPMMSALDAIHPFYDAHREELTRSYEQRVAASAERERQLRENPPAPKNTVITYWKRTSPPIPPTNPGAPK